MLGLGEENNKETRDKSNYIKNVIKYIFTQDN